jgi:cell shape-determining protein MreC
MVCRTLPPMRRPVLIAAVVMVLVASGAWAVVAGWAARPLTAVRRAIQPGSDAPSVAVEPAARELAARLAADNAILRERLDQWREAGAERPIGARQVIARGRIIARSDRAARRYLELDVGRADGVAKGMAVCAGWTLVGEIIAAEDGRSLVQEVGDAQFRCAAVVGVIDAGSATAARLIEGQAAGDGRATALRLEIVGAGSDLPLVEGLPITTAGADGRFLPGLVLGELRRPTREPGDRWSADIRPWRSAARSESLLVVRAP